MVMLVRNGVLESTPNRQPGKANATRISIPEGCNENSPTLQRWVDDLILSKSRRDG